MPIPSTVGDSSFCNISKGAWWRWALFCVLPGFLLLEFPASFDTTLYLSSYDIFWYGRFLWKPWKLLKSIRSNLKLNMRHFLKTRIYLSLMVISFLRVLLLSCCLLLLSFPTVSHSKPCLYL